MGKPHDMPTGDLIAEFIEWTIKPRSTGNDWRDEQENAWHERYVLELRIELNNRIPKPEW
jgi:hypothetical protein